ncbi:hypothetical protein OGATHE_004416 [Ogataea polymorpha]|uniref:Ribosomal protein L2 C-terminal domain-containing protein n=1 Tax=Ogataea polymorpha TaxID=460523 RepID=A0A9P8T2D4_9ASCO|nr:hypothetical protein OGATHE_004416 [Ogataea polymorpha]
MKKNKRPIHVFSIPGFEKSRGCAVVWSALCGQAGEPGVSRPEKHRADRAREAGQHDEKTARAVQGKSPAEAHEACFAEFEVVETAGVPVFVERQALQATYRDKGVEIRTQAAGPQTVVRIEYDPNRTAHIALIKHNETGEFSYIIACEGLREGDEVESFRSGIPDRIMQEMGGKIDPAILAVRISRKGNCLPISLIPVGTIVYNVGEHKNGPAKYCRAAGTYARVVAKDPGKKRAVVQLQSGEQRYVNLEACATLGVTSNAAHHNESLGKAGRNRNKGIRPTVRGVAMNKVDHPLGGGRGKSKSNKPPMSPWGILAKGGFKTRTGKHVNKNKVKDRPRGKKV